MRVRPNLIALFMLAVSASIPDALVAQNLTNDFGDGCCINTAFPRPKIVSQATVPRRILLEAVNCATSNRLMDGVAQTASQLGTKNVLTVSYYFGKYMPEQRGKALTIAVYSADGKAGWLFDIALDGDKYYVANMPELLKAGNHWRVGGIDGGLWSYTRLWYLAQEIGSRPRQDLPVRTVLRFKPASCKSI